MFKTFIILYFYLKTKYFNSFSNREKLIKWQDKQVKKFLKKNLQKSQYYNKKFQSLNIEDWKNFPTINKQELMENFDELNVYGIKKEEAFELALLSEQNRDFTPKIKNITVGLSSGTSGNRGIFLVNDFERYMWVGTALAKLLPYSILKKHRIAFFLRANSNLYESVKSRTIKFEYFDMLNPVEENIQKLNSFNPTLIVAPPSMLKLIAKHYEEIDISPVKIVSVAEVLEDIDKTYLEKIFNQKIHQVYQATEGFIAATCKCGTLHINEDILCVQKEYIDKENNKFVPIITDFTRTTEPIIRYRLNDILTEETQECPCGCKHLAIKKIEGRCDDIFYFLSVDNNEKEIAVFPDFISRAVIFTSPNIQEYKVIQNKDNNIEIYLDKPELFNDVKKSLESLLNKLNCKIPEFILLKELEFNGSRKFKRIERRK